ncbi:MAG: lysophosphatidic acid receptor [Betaproteobacteria bacterium]|nr:lysophosphatidic acid receptor [Betaproteobacteria bacterium]
MDNSKQRTLWVVAMIGGFALSFVGLGVLWAGAPWHYQILMFFPFLLLAFSVTRFGTNALPVLLGALPIGALLLQFRDKNNSHLMPFVIVGAWVVGILLGHYVSIRLKKRVATSG